MTFASTPDPPYWAVVFTSLRTAADDAGYAAAAARMVELAARQPGFLGIESAREDGLGISVSYWASAAAAAGWREVAEHRAVQQLGRERWYRGYRLRVCRVERDRAFER